MVKKSAWVLRKVGSVARYSHISNQTPSTMANYKFTGTIVVEGVRSEKDAIRQLQVMLNDYEDMNPNHKEISIHWDAVEKTS